MTAPYLSVVTPILGGYDMLAQVIGSLERQRGCDFAYEMIVVSDAAEEHPEKVDAAIGEPSFPVTHIRATTPGSAYARNDGWRKAQGEIIVSLDGDVLATRRFLREHAAWHRANPETEVGVIGHVSWSRRMWVTPFMRWIDRGIQFSFHTIRGINAGWGHFNTANFSVKRGMLERVGGFDADRFPFHCEDLDLGYRLEEAGLRLLYNRRAEGRHLHPITLEGYRRRMYEVGATERFFKEVHPDVDSTLHKRFRKVVTLPPARGRAGRLVRFVPPWAPWLGRKVWRSADHYFGQRLAPEYLRGWDEADQAAEGPTRGLLRR